MDNVFDMYEKFKPDELVIEKKKEEKLFELPGEEKQEEKITLPDGFEEALVKKITDSIMEKLGEVKNTEGEGGE